LLGRVKTKDQILNSKLAFNQFFNKIKDQKDLKITVG